MSILQNCYELAGSVKEYMTESKVTRIDLQLLMAPGLLIHLNINEVSTNFMLCTAASIRSQASLYCMFER